MYARLHPLRVGCVGNGFFTGDRDYRPVLMDRDIKKNCSVFIIWQFFLFLGELFLGKAPALSQWKKLLPCLMNAIYLSLSSQKIRIQNFPESQMLSRASVLPRFVSAEIHLPF